MNKLVIIGAGGHGNVIADIAVKNGYSDIVFLDDDPGAEECGGFSVAGKTSDIEKYKDCDFIVAIGNPEVREQITRKLEGFRLVTLIHPAAVIGRNVEIGKGTVVMAGAVINPQTKIGEGCIINTCSSVDHNSCIADFVHVSIGAHLGGTVFVGKGTWIGAGVTVSNDISICECCMIGAGAVVVSNIDQPGTYIGVPVFKIR